MKTAILALGVLCMMGGCSSKATSSKGVVCDATMNTVTIVTNKNDTLSFSTMDASKDEVNGLLLNDTLEVFYTGKYTPGMQASKTVMSMVASALPDMYGVRCNRIVFVCSKKESVRKRLIAMTLLLSLFLALILHE